MHRSSIDWPSTTLVVALAFVLHFTLNTLLLP
jgi:hypothetical protein